MTTALPRIALSMLTARCSSDNDVDPSLPKVWEQMATENVSEAFYDDYVKAAPEPKLWPAVVAKTRNLLLDFKGWPADDVHSIQSPTLLMIGNRDLVLLEPTAQTFCLLPR